MRKKKLNRSDNRSVGGKKRQRHTRQNESECMAKEHVRRVGIQSDLCLLKNN